jgi:hypothetical protein
MLWIAKNTKEISAAREEMMARLADGAKVIQKRRVPTKGGSLNEGNIYQRDGWWAHFGDRPSPRAGNNILWEISFGTTAFSDGASIEFNLPKRGHRNIGSSAGRVVVDVEGKLHLGHRGLLGGGAASVKLTTFEASIRGFAKQEIQWPKIERVFVIEKIDASNFLERLKSYVQEAERLRQLKREGELS